MQTEEKKLATDLFEAVMGNPLTGKITMIGSALRFQDACMHLIEDYEKRGIKEVPISVLTEFIMHGTTEAMLNDVVNKFDVITELLDKVNKLEEIK